MTRSNTEKVVKARRTRRKQPEGYIPRPQNSFFLFRQKFNQNATGCNQVAISVDCSAAWKALSREERAYWEKKAEEEKVAHSRKYPNYKFTRRMPAKRAVEEAQVANVSDTSRAGSDERDLSSDGATPVNDPVQRPAPIDATFSLSPTPDLPFTVDQYIPRATWVPVPTYHPQPQRYSQLNDLHHSMNIQDDRYSQQNLYAWKNSSTEDEPPQSDPVPIVTVNPQLLINDATPYYY